MVEKSGLNTPLCVILCPLWPNSGSANIFAAQVRAYQKMHFDVVLLAVAHDGSSVSHRTGDYNALIDRFTFSPSQRLYFTRPADGLKRFLSRGYWRWIMTGRRSAMAIHADVATHSSIPAEFLRQLKTRPISVIHVNHCINMGLARRIKQSATGARTCPALIVLDTHDIQAERYLASGVDNPFTNQPDDGAALTRDEADLCSGADVLLHLTNRDHRHFCGMFPDGKNYIVRPTIKDEPKQVNFTVEAPIIDFLYIGNQHGANRKSIEWFLTEVMPLLETSGLRVAIAGAVAHAVRQTNPALYAAHGSKWLGEVPSVAALYAISRFVIAPTVSASGTSIKLIEALAMGKFIVTSGAVEPAFDGVEGIGQAIIVAHDASQFANSMLALAARKQSVNHKGHSVYQRHFSNSRYQSRLAEVLGKTPRAVSNRMDG